MFKLDSSQNIELSDTERNYLKRICKSYGIDLYGVNVVRNSGLTWKGAVACFSTIHPDTVFICTDQEILERLLPHIAHELKHREQYRRMGWLTYNLATLLGRFRGINGSLEKEAYAEEDRIKLELGL